MTIQQSLIILGLMTLWCMAEARRRGNNGNGNANDMPKENYQLYNSYPMPRDTDMSGNNEYSPEKAQGSNNQKAFPQGIRLTDEEYFEEPADNEQFDPRKMEEDEDYFWE